MGGKANGLTVEELNACSPDAIDGVAASWERLSSAMDGDEGRLQAEILAPLRGSWVSRDGERAIELLGYVGNQLQAVRQESWAMSTILREAAIELRTAQDALRRALDDLDRNSMTRHADGRITWQTEVPSQQELLTATATDIANRIAGALRQATDADALAATTMNRNVDLLKGSAKNNFNDWALGAEPAADARRVSDLLAKLKDGGISSEDMALLKLLTQDNAGDPAYQATLLRTMTPATLLDVTRVTSQPWRASNMSANDLQFIQDTLRTALSASSAELAKDTAWINQLKLAGRDVDDASTAPTGGNLTFGYQSLDVLLRQGTYDPAFLLAVGDDVLAYDKELNDRGVGWGTRDPNRDPVTGLMLALKNNPGAATEFFGVQVDGRNQVVRDGKAALEYLADERELRDRYGGSKPHLDPLGGAIASATTAQPGGADTLEVIKNVVTVLGADGSSALEQSPGLRNGATQMLVANPASLHGGLSNNSGPVSAVNMPPGFSAADVERKDMTQMVGDLVKDKANAVALQQTQQAFTWAGLTAIAEDPAFSDDALGYTARADALKAFTGNSSEVFGAIDRHIADEIRREQIAGDASANATTERVTRWVGGAASAAATFIHGKYEWVGDVGAIAIDKASSEINQILRQDSSADANARISQAYVENLTVMTDTALRWQVQYNASLPPGTPPVNIVDVVDGGYNTGEQTTKGTMGSPG